jgi:hypothetical protein
MFELPTTEALLSSVTNRVEKHGQEEVPAMSFGFKITAANTILDLLSPTLRGAIYMAVEGQEQLPGVEPSTPLLRTKEVETLALKAAFEGWTLTVDHGIDESSAIVLSSCKVDAFRVAPKEGGSVELFFRVGTNDIDREEAGILWSKNHQDVTIQLTAPKKAEGPVIDGSVGHPGLAGQQDELEAGDIFADMHGDGPGDREDDADDEGGIDADPAPAPRPRPRAAAKRPAAKKVPAKKPVAKKVAKAKRKARAGVAA